MADRRAELLPERGCAPGGGARRRPAVDDAAHDRVDARLRQEDRQRSGGSRSRRRSTAISESARRCRAAGRTRSRSFAPTGARVVARAQWIGQRVKRLDGSICGQRSLFVRVTQTRCARTRPRVGDDTVTRALAAAVLVLVAVASAGAGAAATTPVVVERDRGRHRRAVGDRRSDRARGLVRRGCADRSGSERRRRQSDPLGLRDPLGRRRQPRGPRERHAGGRRADRRLVARSGSGAHAAQRRRDRSRAVRSSTSRRSGCRARAPSSRRSMAASRRSWTRSTQAGLGSPFTKYVVYFDGPTADSNVCGQGGSDSSGFGAAVVYYRSCAGVSTAAVAAHEVLHTLGAVSRSAPNECDGETSGHTCDTEADLMFPSIGGEPLSSKLLDPGRDDYYGHAGGWTDTQDSAWLVRLDGQAPLALTISGPGSVTANVPGLLCAASCTTTWNAGQPLALTATPGAGARLVRWSGACSGTAALQRHRGAGRVRRARCSLRRRSGSASRSAGRARSGARGRASRAGRAARRRSRRSVPCASRRRRRRAGSSARGAARAAARRGRARCR